jgi:hypothetical protein
MTRAVIRVNTNSRHKKTGYANENNSLVIRSWTASTPAVFLADSRLLSCCLLSLGGETSNPQNLGHWIRDDKLQDDSSRKVPADPERHGEDPAAGLSLLKAASLSLPGKNIRRS